MTTTTADLALNFIDKVNLVNMPSGITIGNAVDTAFEIEGNFEKRKAIIYAHSEILFKLKSQINEAGFREEIRPTYAAVIDNLLAAYSYGNWSAPAQQFKGVFVEARIQLMHMQGKLENRFPQLLQTDDVFENAIDSIEQVLQELRKFDSEFEEKKIELINDFELIRVFLKNANCMPMNDALNLYRAAILKVHEFQSSNKSSRVPKTVMSALFRSLVLLGELGSAYHGAQLAIEGLESMYNYSHEEQPVEELRGNLKAIIPQKPKETKTKNKPAE